MLLAVTLAFGQLPSAFATGSEGTGVGNPQRQDDGNGKGAGKDRNGKDNNPPVQNDRTATNRTPNGQSADGNRRNGNGNSPSDDGSPAETESFAPAGASVTDTKGNASHRGSGNGNSPASTETQAGDNHGNPTRNETLSNGRQANAPAKPFITVNEPPTDDAPRNNVSTLSANNRPAGRTERSVAPVVVAPPTRTQALTEAANTAAEDMWGWSVTETTTISSRQAPPENARAAAVNSTIASVSTRLSISSGFDPAFFGVDVAYFEGENTPSRNEPEAPASNLQPSRGRIVTETGDLAPEVSLFVSKIDKTGGFTPDTFLGLDFAALFAANPAAGSSR